MTKNEDNARASTSARAHSAPIVPPGNDETQKMSAIDDVVDNVKSDEVTAVERQNVGEKNEASTSTGSTGMHSIDFKKSSKF